MDWLRCSISQRFKTMTKCQQQFYAFPTHAKNQARAAHCQNFVMAPTKTSKTSSATTKTKKEKVFHPQSRKADQLARKSIRKDKLAGQSSDRKTKNSILGWTTFSCFKVYLSTSLSIADFYGFFYHSLPPEGALSLDDLHNLIANVWLKRFDEELEAERASRRKGRPKSTKEQKLEELKLRESVLYRTGFGVFSFFMCMSSDIKIFTQRSSTLRIHLQSLSSVLGIKKRLLLSTYFGL